jgi:hypothetical protein
LRGSTAPAKTAPHENKNSITPAAAGAMLFLPNMTNPALSHLNIIILEKPALLPPAMESSTFSV